LTRVTFWGTRGSCPCSGPEITRYGGATACVSVEAEPGLPPIVFDLGTGSRPLGHHLVESFLPPGGPIAGAPEEPMPNRHREFSLELFCFVTHLHFDHVQGLPFFLPALREEAHLKVFGPSQGEVGLKGALAGFIRPPYFPVGLDELPAELEVGELKDSSVVSCGSASRVLARSLPHRGPTLGYRLETGSASVAYLSDHQAPRGSGDPVSKEAMQLAGGVDLLIHDAQYTKEEFSQKAHWGHSTLSFALQVAAETGAKKLALFHHDPTHDDQFLDDLGQQAEKAAGSRFEVLVARDGDSLEIG
jgi:phosphoribosyl 1,2-cyclic phosphodiesterase